MAYKAQLEDYFMWKGELVKVMGISDSKTIHFEPVVENACPHCGQKREFSIIEASPLFQENAKPIHTIK